MELFHDFFNYPFGGLHFLTRYAHILFGITWIGLLYFFNVVQVPAYAEMEASARARSAAQDDLPRAVVVPMGGRHDVGERLC